MLPLPRNLLSSTVLWVGLAGVLWSQPLTLELGVDVNGDGEIIFPATSESGRLPVDRTSADKPFLFWTNYDQDDLDFFESWPIVRKDVATETIDSPRDLEDFTRLHLKLSESWVDLKARAGVEVTFEIHSESERPEIQMVRSADPAGTRRYLLDPDWAARQRADPFGSRAVLLESDQPWTIALESFRDWDLPGESKLMPLLFEGISEGEGYLVVTIKQAGKVLAESEPLYLEIRHIKSFFRRVGVEWPEGYKNPPQYNQEPPVPDLHWEFEPMGHPYVKPWYEEDDVIVWIHGWVNHTKDFYERSVTVSTETIFKRFWHQGFRGRFDFFHWPTVKGKLAGGLNTSEYRGYKRAPVLLDYFSTFPAEKRIHLTAHSLGNVVMLEVIKLGADIEQAVFQSAAVPAEVFDSRQLLTLPTMRNANTPTSAADMGYAGYLEGTDERIYVLYNPRDITFFGWNIMQKEAKPFRSLTRRYVYRPDKPAGERMRLKYGLFFSRPVTDPHEAKAYVAQSRSHALGAESRTRGVVHELHDLDRKPFEHGPGHILLWSDDPQVAMPYYNLLLDLMNLPYNSLAR